MALPVRVLLIDDNLADRIRYRRMLQKEGTGFEVVEAEDGAAALNALDTTATPFDCVLLDQDLPDLQGLDLLDDIRQRAAAPQVVMLTGEEDAAISIEALRRGAADYLMKRRIDEDRLKRAIHGAIERARLAHQLHQNELRLALFYRLANQTDDALFIVDAASARVTDCNEAARRRLRLSSGDPGHVAQPAAFASPELWTDFCRRARAEGSASRQDDDRPVIVEILARCVEEEGRPYIVAVGRDVTLRNQREQSLIEQSARDGLTGIWNRRAFDERLEQYWGEAAREGRPLAVVMLDVDHFKAYNDSLGHLAGDDCLCQIARALRSGLLLGSPMLARYGGEEFVALLDNADIDRAVAVAERLRTAVVGLALPHPKSPISAGVTINAGAASVVPTLDGDRKILVARADAALYRAKQEGRDRTIAYSPCGFPRPPQLSRGPVSIAAL